MTYVAMPDVALQCHATCHVKGGPAYEARRRVFRPLSSHTTSVSQVPLVAQSGETRFDVTPRDVDFGPCRYGTTAQQKLTIRNTGAVPFRFDVLLDRLQFASLVHCAPTTGHLSPHSEMTVQLRMNIAVPGHLHETLEISIEHGESIAVALHAECLCSVLTTSLPSTAPSDANASSSQLDTYRDDIAYQIRQIWTSTHDDARPSPTVTNPVAFANRHARRCRALRIDSGLLDYGTLTKGDIASQPFTLTNAGPLPVTYAVTTNSPPARPPARRCASPRGRHCRQGSRSNRQISKAF